jgi:hypothetical protein
MGCANATHDDKKNVDFSTRPMLADGIGEGGIFVANHVCGGAEVVVIAIFPFLYVNLLIEEYRRRPFVWPTNLSSRSRTKSGLCARGLNSEGSNSSWGVAWYEVRE